MFAQPLVRFGIAVGVVGCLCLLASGCKKPGSAAVHPLAPTTAAPVARGGSSAPATLQPAVTAPAVGSETMAPAVAGVPGTVRVDATSATARSLVEITLKAAGDNDCVTFCDPTGYLWARQEAKIRAFTPQASWDQALAAGKAGFERDLRANDFYWKMMSAYYRLNPKVEIIEEKPAGCTITLEFPDGHLWLDATNPYSPHYVKKLHFAANVGDPAKAKRVVFEELAAGREYAQMASPPAPSRSPAASRSPAPSASGALAPLGASKGPGASTSPSASKSPGNAGAGSPPRRPP